MGNLEAFLVLAIVYYIGEFIGTKTKAWVPSVFVIAALFVIGYWTFFPNDIVDLAGLGAPLGGTIVIMLCITHMGTMISIKQLCEQWKIILIALAGLAGMMIACWFICVPLVGRELVIAGLPPLTGGAVAATIMNTAALEKGLTQAAALAIAMYAVQGFAGYPLTAICLKKEGKLLLQAYRKGDIQAVQGSAVDEDAGNLKAKDSKKKRLIPAVPGKYITTALILAKLAAVSLLASKLSELTGGRVNQAVITLLLGIVFMELGFLEKNALQKAKADGFLLYVLMVYVFSGLKDVTPDMLLSCIGPMLIIIVIGVIGLAIFSILAGRLLKVSWRMAFATSLTALYGFPPNYVLTEESANSMAETPEEKQYLMDHMLPQMLVGGFVTVTITSVVIAGIFVNLL